MSINYNIKADQILGILGYNQPAGEGFLNGFERENNVKLPLCLRNFYKVAYKCPLLSTADIWTDDMFFYYKQIKEEIEDKEAIEKWLSTTLGKKVEIKTPKKGEKLRFFGV